MMFKEGNPMYSVFEKISYIFKITIWATPRRFGQNNLVEARKGKVCKRKFKNYTKQNVRS